MTAAGVEEAAGVLAGARRGRAWRLLGCVLALVLLYLTWWTFYALTHTRDRFVQLPPGAVASGTSERYQLVSLVVSHELRGSRGPSAPDRGALWVVAHLRVTGFGHPKFGYVCRLNLVGRHDRVWEPQMFTDVGRNTASCLDAKEGRPLVVELIYQVPAADASTLYGLAVENDTAAPMKLLVP